MTCCLCNGEHPLVDVVIGRRRIAGRLVAFNTNGVGAVVEVDGVRLTFDRTRLRFRHTNKGATK